MPHRSSQIFQDCVKEESEKDKRKHNIVVYGLAENDSEDGKERQYYDTASTRGMLDYLEIEGEVKRVIRLEEGNWMQAKLTRDQDRCLWNSQMQTPVRKQRGKLVSYAWDQKTLKNYISKQISQKQNVQQGTNS